MAAPERRVIPLDQLRDFEVADEDPDVRGWEVIGVEGRKIGKVDDLLVDTDAMKVRYLDVDLDREMRGSDGERHILIPIGYARLDQDQRRISVDALEASSLSAIPAYTHQPITRDYETQLRAAFDRDYPERAPRTDTTEGDFYAHDIYDSDRFYGERRDTGADEERRITLSEEELSVGRRDHVAGDVEIDKNVETQHVRERVPTRHEEVVVERKPARSDMTGEARIEEDEIRVPLNEEELVVDKRAVPKEELVVRKRDVVEDEIVEGDVRRERAEVRKRGDVNVREEES